MGGVRKRGAKEVADEKPKASKWDRAEKHYATQKRMESAKHIVAVAVIIMCAVAAMSMMATRSTAVVDIDINNEEKVKEVIYGGEPWMIMCDEDGASEATKKTPMHEMFSEAADILAPGINAGVMDCSIALKSGKNLMEKFDLKVKKDNKGNPKPLMFVSANGDKPVQVPWTSGTKKASNIASFVKKTIKPAFMKPSSTAQLTKFCFKRKQGCAAVLHKGIMRPSDRKTMNELMAQHRLLKFVVLDTRNYELQSEINPFSMGSDKQSKVIHFRKLELGDDQAGAIEVDERKLRLGGRMFKGKLDESKVAEFLAKGESDSSFKVLTKVPALRYIGKPKKGAPKSKEEKKAERKAERERLKAKNTEARRSKEEAARKRMDEEERSQIPEGVDASEEGGDSEAGEEGEVIELSEEEEEEEVIDLE